MGALAGYLRTQAASHSPRVLSAMLAAMSRRGPDDVGAAFIDASVSDASAAARFLNVCYPDSAAGAPDCTPADRVSDFTHTLALGHRRFSLYRFVAAAHQPFWSAGQNLCIALDGAIYNHPEIRSELESLGHQFQTPCEIEVIAHAYQQWGTECFSKFAGFWAMSLYDAQRRKLLLSRDRVGQSPLYIARADGAFWWCSHLGPLLQAAGASNFPINGHAVSNFLAFADRDSFDQTFYQGVTTFPKASFAWIEPDGTFTPQRYWHLPQTRLKPSRISVPDAAAEVRTILGVAVRGQLRADAPVAFELSGGMDSSSLVAAAGTDVRMSAYSITFPGPAPDELPYARMVEERYRNNLDLHVIEQPIADFFESADEYVAAMAEPFHSPNMLANRRIWLAMAEQGIRASVNGAAGDELFAPNYLPYLALLLKRGSLLELHREVIACSEDPAPAFSGLYRWRMKRAAKMLGQQIFSGAAINRIQHQAHQRLAGFGLKLPLIPAHRPLVDENQSLLDDMSDWQINYWMRSSDQSSSSAPFEIRMPFLDHRLIDFAFALPMNYLMRDGWAKWILRIAMQDLLPKEIVWRAKKMGFPFPYKTWLAASRPTVAAALAGLDCPYIDGDRIMQSYDAIAQADPKLLWRIISVALWWKKCVLGQSLSNLSGSSAKVFAAA